MFSVKSKKCTTVKWRRNLDKSLGLLNKSMNMIMNMNTKYTKKKSRKMSQKYSKLRKLRNPQSHSRAWWIQSVSLIASSRTFSTRMSRLSSQSKHWFNLTKQASLIKVSKCNSQWRRWKCLLSSLRTYSMHSISEHYTWGLQSLSTRSEERRVGKECV